MDDWTLVEDRIVRFADKAADVQAKRVASGGRSPEQVRQDSFEGLIVEVFVARRDDWFDWWLERFKRKGEDGAIDAPTGDQLKSCLDTDDIVSVFDDRAENYIAYQLRFRRSREGTKVYVRRLGTFTKDDIKDVEFRDGKKGRGVYVRDVRA